MANEKTENEKLLEKIDGFEKTIKDLQEENKTLKSTNEELTTKLAKLKIDGLTKEVQKQDTKVEEPEEIEFDFDFH
jgi:regulator of replication initiation timing